MDAKKRVIQRISAAAKEHLLRDFVPFLSKGKFVNVATCSSERMPNVAPKLIGRVEKNIIYLIDYVMGKSYANLKENPRVSVSFIDDRTLTGYQLNGSVDIVEKGVEFEEILQEFQQIKTDLTVERILLNMRTGERRSLLEFSLPEKFAIIKVKVLEIIEITSSGNLHSRFAIE